MATNKKVKIYKEPKVWGIYENLGAKWSLKWSMGRPELYPRKSNAIENTLQRYEKVIPVLITPLKPHKHGKRTV